MLATPLLHKPVDYGSMVGDLLFVTGISIHFLCALVATGAGLGALATRKGARVHRKLGGCFVFAMYSTALSGIVLDLVRLNWFFEENHTKYVDYAMPSSIPARYGFLFAGFCVLYLLHMGARKTILSTLERRPGPFERIWPAGLLLLGLWIWVRIELYYNPWTGALWMIWTFMILVASVAYFAGTDRYAGPGVRNRLLHRFCMIFLLMFCLWGGFQGFLPAISLQLNGVENTSPVYLGNRQGGFDWAFWFFLAGWAPFYFLALILFKHFGGVSGRR